MSEQPPDWIRELYEARAAQLLLYGRALGLSHGEAEDVLQDTFVALLGLGQVPDHPAGYCVRTYRNRALNHRRGFWRRVWRELESSRWFEPAGVGGDAREVAAMRRLESLVAEQREVIVLKIWHRCTFEEIGELTGVSPNTAAGRYRYGMEKLRAALEGVEHECEQPFGGVPDGLDTAAPLGPR